MSVNELEAEVKFGLENMEKINHRSIFHINDSDEI